MNFKPDLDLKGTAMPQRNVAFWIRQNIGMALLVSMFVGSLLLNAKLGLDLKHSAQPVAGVDLKSDLRTIAVIDAEGTPQKLKLGNGKPTVLYIMAPTCHWCAENIENIRALAKAAGSQYDFIGISNTGVGLAEHLKVKPLPFSVYSADMDHLPKGFNPRATPQTVLVGADGRVERVWQGAFQPKTQEQVERYFHTKLPGLIKPAEL